MSGTAAGADTVPPDAAVSSALWGAMDFKGKESAADGKRH
jgi:hypothetical protein